MTIEQGSHHLIETQRPYSTPLDFKNAGDSYLVNDKWAVRLMVVYREDGRARLYFVSDTFVIREKALLKEGFSPRQIDGVSGLALTLKKRDNIVYFGEEYKLTFIGPQRYRLQSTEPIRLVPISPNVDLLDLLSQG